MSCTSRRNVRTVPTSCAWRGITLNAPRSPACIAHRLTTALSIGSTLRDTRLCAAVMMCAGHQHRIDRQVGMRAVAAAAVTRSRCGRPRPSSAPVFSADRARRQAGQLCIAYTASTGKRSNRPSSIIALAPAKPSSPGWKISTACRRSGASRPGSAPRRAASRVAVVAAAVHEAAAARAPGELVLLVHRQRVHVGAQADRFGRWPVCRAADHADDAGLADAGRAPRRRRQTRSACDHARRGAVLLEAELGMRVQVAAERRQLALPSRRGG